MEAAAAAVRERMDVGQVIGESVTLTSDEDGAMVARCPFHGEDESGQLVIRPASGMYYCFTCGDSGDVIKYVSRRDGLTFPQAVTRLFGRLLSPEPAAGAADGLTAAGTDPAEPASEPEPPG